MSWKTSVLLTCQILGLRVNTLAADEKCPVLKRENLTVQIQMELSQKQKIFSPFLLLFLNLAQILKILTKKMTLIYFLFPKLRTPKTWSDKCPKSPVSHDSSTSNTVNVPKHGQNLQHCTFIIFIDRCKLNWPWKRPSYSHTKWWDCLLTHWLLIKSILFLIETISRYQFRCNYVGKIFFSIFYWVFEVQIELSRF